MSDEHLSEDERRARAALGRAIRDVCHAAIGRQAPIGVLESVTSRIADAAALLDTHPARVRAADSFPNWQATPADGDPIITFQDRPISGEASPYGCDLDSFRRGDEAVTRFTLRAAHEGAPGRSHGGFVSAIFDDVFGFVLQIHEIPGFTGELSVRYEAGTPIGRELEMRARLDRREGRKLFMTADLWDGDKRLATAKATFIEASFSTPVE
jgi:acyl-coenzyme A thioesterase PaaI-like protein